MEYNIEFHLHALPDPDVIEQGRLLDGDTHVHDDHVRIVKQVQDRGLSKVQLLKLDILKLRLQACKTNNIISQMIYNSESQNIRSKHNFYNRAG